MEHEGIAASGVDGSPKATIEAAISSKSARRSRSGSHLRQRGEVWYYRRAVPKDARKAFGCWEIIKSLDTTSETEAKRLEKQHDVDFERRLQRAREEANPETRQARIASDIIALHPLNYPMAQWGMAYLPAKDREAVREIIAPHYEALDAHRHEIARLVEEITKALPPTPLPPELWQRCRHGIISVVRQHVATVTGETAPVIDGIHTLEWAYSRWLRTRTGVRTEESVDTARRHFDAFVVDSKLVMLDQVRRSHVEAWRDRLVDCHEYRPNSINQRLQLVGAILRAGWRSAEMPEQNLKGLVLPNPDDNDRAAWKPDEILKALRALEPNTWASWVYLIGLTTGVRIGEPVAARVDWFDSR